MNYADLSKLMTPNGLDTRQAAENVSAATDLAIRTSRCMQRAGARIIDEQIAVLTAMASGLRPLAEVSTLNDVARVQGDFARGLGECVMRSTLNVLDTQREMGEELYRLAGEGTERLLPKVAASTVRKAA